MPTLQKTDDVEIVSVTTSDKSIEDLLSKEWLLTNGRGGYASSTIVGCNTRRYHGLLIGSLNPPANRIMALANCLEMIIFNGRVFNLSTFEFNEKFAPKGFGYIKQFRQDTGVHFDYQLDKFELTKSVYLLRDTDTVGLVYDFTRVEEPAEFALRPFIGLRDFHTLQKSYTHLCSAWLGDGLVISHNIPESCKLFLSCAPMNTVRNSTMPNTMQKGEIPNSVSFEKDEQWWFNFVYRNDRQRGQDFTEDLWTPGFFKCRIEAPAKIVFRANLSERYNPDELLSFDIDAACKDLRRHQNSIITAAKTKDKKLGPRFAKSSQNGNLLRTLCLAADQFISKRQTANRILTTNHEQQTTILAGFPWFMDWGRDVFVALPGLLLLTGRFDEAKSALTTFSAALDDGLIPNRFDDRSDDAHFNSIDTSLWFINAAFQHLDATGDSETFTQQFLPTIHRIIDSYHNGTRFGIYADADGLITGGDNETQLTWMDAKYERHSFTPRYGKAVEVNALWYNSLMLIAQFYADPVRSKSTKKTGGPSAQTSNGAERDMETAKHYKSIADKVAASFCKLFWNETVGYLNDCILPDGSVDASLRPNQIFAVSLPFSPLPLQQQKCVVDVVQKELLTPYGLRTLSARDSRYKGKYEGPQQQRDEAYHQGTVWPYLIGPFVASFLKVNDFSQKSKDEALKFIEPLMRHLIEDGCFGQVCEIFDGDAPHKPRGCTAQAWSVAELIRAYHLINS